MSRLAGHQLTGHLRLIPQICVELGAAPAREPEQRQAGDAGRAFGGVQLDPPLNGAGGDTQRTGDGARGRVAEVLQQQGQGRQVARQVCEHGLRYRLQAGRDHPQAWGRDQADQARQAGGDQAHAS